ncbi:flagellar FlbD family protein [Diplocloster hominis]|uniref:flagellar FlbD family protein n=1 Tax=Diplocloster hominis TaxID=3079010 RepID=UPI0031BA1679
MIILTKLNGEKFVLNSELIETITENPDTTILLTNGKHLLVRERMEDVIEKTAEFRRKTFTDLLDGIRRQDSEE